MSPSLEEVELADLWRRPPDEECDGHIYTGLLPGAESTERLKFRLSQHRFTYELVEFAIVFQTLAGGKWCDVLEMDSCHDVDVHLHRYAKSTGERVGDPEVLHTIQSLEDVQTGYELALSLIESDWRDYKERWSRA